MHDRNWTYSDSRARREGGEEEPSEGESELCLIGIIAKGREMGEQKREQEIRDTQGTAEPKRPPLCIRSTP